MILKALNNYQPYNQQEEKDLQIIKDHILSHKNIFTRDNLTAHMTASAWVVNKELNRVLMVYHNLYDSWSWLGGHADGQENLLEVAKKEILEESGLKTIKVLCEDIFSIEVLTVDGHIKKGAYVSSHLHLNVTYLFQADENDALSIKADENSDVKWFGLDEAIEASTEPWFQENIYKKLNEKLKKCSIT